MADIGKLPLVGGVLDSYTRSARITPVFLLLVPLGIGIAGWFPNANVLKSIGTIILAPFAFASLLAQFGREPGYRKQKELWKKWGGPPTTRFLRHRNTEFNSVVRSRFHKKFKDLLPDVKIPTLEEEKQNPEAADQVYEACTRYLISHTRDRTRFPLVFKENVNYGFLRNLWGLRPLGIGLSVVGFFACGVRVWHDFKMLDTISVELIIGSLVNLGLVCLWWFWVSGDAVRVAANAYAERLLEACEQLSERS